MRNSDGGEGGEWGGRRGWVGKEGKGGGLELKVYRVRWGRREGLTHVIRVDFLC